MNEKKTVRLYNVLFPLWFFYVFPSYAWLLILAGNFVIDLAVTWIGCKKLGEEPADICRKSILKVWLIGFFSDFVGAAFTFLLFMGFSFLNDYVFRFSFDPARGFFCILFSLPGLFLAALLIYRLNKRFSFKNTGLETDDIRRLCFWLALFTAPYLMVLPTYW